MKNNAQTKIFIGALYVFVIAIAVLIGFAWKVSEEAQTMYIVVKCLCVAALATHALLSLAFGKRFAARMPQTLLLLVLQLVPMLARIKFGNPIIGIILFVVIFLIFFLCYFLYGLSNKKFTEDEDRAKPSSNAEIK